MKFLLSASVLLSSLSFAATVRAADSSLIAFPGAEGFGRFARGGRGGEVYHVTTLNDAGPGSFRDAVSKPNRTVVFEVGGVIRLTSRVAVSPNITIAGQSAPGGGVCIYGNGVSFSGADNAIVRHIRFRMGTKGDSGKDAVTLAHGKNLIFDHVSVSWGRDENFSINGAATNVTIQDCIVAQGLQHHSAGGLIQTSGGVSILRTLYIDNNTRNPKVKGMNQYVNNVVYNWGKGGCYILGDSAGPSWANVVNNYFIAGPDTGTPPFTRGNLNFRIFATGNKFDGDRNGEFNGVEIQKDDYGVVSWEEKAFEYPEVKVLTANDALKHVIANAGASLRRDSVDQRLIAELLSAGKLGQIITNEMDAPMFGPGTVASGTAAPDLDRDGMADAWELANGLDPKNPDDRNAIGPSGYTRLEEYLNQLVDGSVRTARRKDSDGKPRAAVDRSEHSTVGVVHN